MRIITGLFKGAKLKTLKGDNVRPTLDRVKESVFSILENLFKVSDFEAIENKKVLDLFAGTGNLGLESLSRGADSITFVDKSTSSLNILKDNIESLKVRDHCQVVKSDAIKFIDNSADNFDLIFLDPPYNQGFVKNALNKIDKKEILNINGIIVIEHSRHEEIDFVLEKLIVFRQERYGEVIVSFLMLKNNEITK
ncbi:16S rRNA (guanine(966)-N(2))-methyltransferase RsmD [Selenomonadales bacterium OttesenSCG-928-I06]|nr:16S rRNA (guanine(966)-N(2))-methyltransferase RsmD [Selenomonadales bacterium OttesenSCG-928-I06]